MKVKIYEFSYLINYLDEKDYLEITLQKGILKLKIAFEINELEKFIKDTKKLVEDYNYGK